MMIFLAVILFGISMLALAASSFKPPRAIKTREEEHDPIPQGVIDFVSITLAASLGVVVALKLVM
jgi:hypothetical protein